MILLEEVPSNWQQRWRFWKVSSGIVCVAMADLSASLAELSRKKRAKALMLRHDNVYFLCSETFNKFVRAWR